MPLSFEARLRCSVVPLLFRQALTIYRAHFRTFISLALVTILPLFGTYLVGLLAPVVGYRLNPRGIIRQSAESISVIHQSTPVHLATHKYCTTR